MRPRSTPPFAERAESRGHRIGPTRIPGNTYRPDTPVILPDVRTGGVRAGRADRPTTHRDTARGPGDPRTGRAGPDRAYRRMGLDLTRSPLSARWRCDGPL